MLLVTLVRLTDLAQGSLNANTIALHIRSYNPTGTIRNEDKPCNFYQLIAIIDARSSFFLTNVTPTYLLPIYHTFQHHGSSTAHHRNVFSLFSAARFVPIYFLPLLLLINVITLVYVYFSSSFHFYRILGTSFSTSTQNVTTFFHRTYTWFYFLRSLLRYYFLPLQRVRSRYDKHVSLLIRRMKSLSTSTYTI